MRPFRALIVLAVAACGLAGAPARAQPAVTSAGPDSVAVTIYRDPRRGSREIDLEWLEGYALVTETRRVTIPAGRAVIRFEGVAGGILPESAVIAGLPDGVREKNLDAALLSPRSLYAGSFGRPVTLRRTIDGKVTEERAIIRSGPEGAAIVETREGFLAADCGEGKEALVYDAVPPGLSAKPTLSVETVAAQGGEAVLTLSYLAWGFDWEASYIATMRPDGRTADLFGWITLANGDVTSFAAADTTVVAADLERETGPDDVEDRFDEPAFALKCFFKPVVPNNEPLVPPPPPLPDQNLNESVSRMSAGVVDAIMAQDISFGDVRAYRVPHRTTVAAKSQKQVGLLARESVAVEVVYVAGLYDQDAGDKPDERGVKLALRAQNRKEAGLGLALPGGRIAVFEPEGDARLLIGEASFYDHAVGQEVQVGVAESEQVRARLVPIARGKRWRDYSYTVTNANPHPVRFEMLFYPMDGYRRSRVSAKLGRRWGLEQWKLEIPAGGEAVLRYRLTWPKGEEM